MASESTDERTRSVALPAELDDWLEQHVASGDVDRETLLVGLLASYRHTVESEGELTDQLPLEKIAQEALEETLDERVTEQVSEATNAVQRQLGNRIDELEADYRENLQDVRGRVIDVAKDTRAKAAEEHSHDEFEALETMEGELQSLQVEIDNLKEDYSETVPEHQRHIEEFDERIETLEDRLKTVAWVVSDLREAHESGGGLETVERIKRAAARADIERANCENCGESVALALLTDPECPHCNAAVSNVEPSGGWFGKPKLLVASQLESGDNS